MKTIITGVDSSQTALTAAEKAAELAASFDAELYVFSAYAINSAVAIQTAKSGNMANQTSEAYQRLANSQASAAQEAADSVAAILRNTWPNLQVKAFAVEGQPAEVLLKQADKLKADAIVVGNKRAQGFSRILGSISRNVAAEAKCDLYIVNTTRQ
ncbi:universal stress protein [Corynebacterium ammoniagenes]|jgi:nucleotide-binding universal stress UspA family protein|uniref:Universal stress protein A n=2 Tax=Corynebacterium ammoniagenes TaxID=1697 RepID=A0AAV5G9D6_CORAM|nr:universal stress protein [Corynebacterium ammoniagenes]APT83354.1 universal stress protein UspA [Corynebacterium ammoniagenes DSM 20306]AQS74367.1 universal stress protein UspA [Corynebacterium ammoniagenes]EFG81396.1 universal stress family protein [Corynebacterium ammoniagenes DSM 20306]NMF32946.1 universal stress protein [Corynebacterium ammoniagenes]GJN43982.1 universal stress protein A [Corynebacterium ammoniagenes]